MGENLNALVRRAWRCAEGHGFHDGRNPKDPQHVLAELMLITTEVAEAAEAVRTPDFGNLAEELANICIRVFDTAQAQGIDLEREIVKKMVHNEIGHLPKDCTWCL